MSTTLTIIFGSACIIHVFFYRRLVSPTGFESVGHRYSNYWGKLIMTLTPGWSHTVEGTENLGNEPVVYVANHSSMVDIWVMCTLGLDFRWLSKEQYFKIPLVGTAMRYSGYIAVKRGNKKSQHDALIKSAEALRRRDSMFFFPEGTRSKTAELLEFKTGAFKLAHECGVAIQPIVLFGANRLLKKGNFIPAKAHLHTKILPKRRIEDPSQIKEFAAAVRTDIQNELDRLRSTSGPASI